MTQCRIAAVCISLTIQIVTDNIFSSTIAGVLAQRKDVFILLLGMREVE